MKNIFSGQFGNPAPDYELCVDFGWNSVPVTYGVGKYDLHLIFNFAR